MQKPFSNLRTLQISSSRLIDLKFGGLPNLRYLRFSNSLNQQVPGIVSGNVTSEYGLVSLFSDDLNECRKLKCLSGYDAVFKELPASLSECFTPVIFLLSVLCVTICNVVLCTCSK